VKKLFWSFADLSDGALDWQEWVNVWRPKTPYSLKARWSWLKEHSRTMGVRFTAVEFLKKATYALLRRWLYIKPVRVWNLKRVFPNIINYKDKI
jgi:hypothetical protein